MEIGRALREAADVVVGWRAWTVRETDAGLRLGSVIHDLVWDVGEAAVASCRRDDDPFAEPVPLHPVPGGECNCGFHVARDPADALPYLRGRDEADTIGRILGEVAAWGHVIRTERGWRASMAYPVRLYVADVDVGDALAEYGVPIWTSASATSSTASSAGSWTSSPSAARMRSPRTAASG
jgi:hypothetical protein